MKEKKDIKEFIKTKLKNISNLITLLSDNNLYFIESKFNKQIKIDINFSEYALFNSQGCETKSIGEIICFLDSSCKNLFSEYISTDSREIFFDENNFEFFLKNSEDKFKYAFVIKEDCDSDFLNISNMEIFDIGCITLLKSKDDSLKCKFVENYKDIIIDTIFEEFKMNKLNEKGIYFLISVISELINFFSNKESKKIFEYLWQYYISNKKEEDELKFISFEFIENILNKYINNFCQKIKYIEKSNEENAIKEFVYIIQNYDISLYYKQSNKIFEFGQCLCNPIYEKYRDDEILEIYNTNYSLNYLNYYKYNEIYSDDIIEYETILFTDAIRSTLMISELSELIEKNNNKIKIIFILFINFNDDFNFELAKFIKKYKIPIFLIENNLSKIIYEFFIEGKGNIFDYLEKKNSNYEYYYEPILNYEEEFFRENKEEEKDINDDKNNKDENSETFMDIGLLFEFEKKLDIKKFKKEQNIMYNKIFNKQKRFFKFGAVKFSKRLIYDLIYLNKDILYDMKHIFGDINNLIDIFNYMCLEYYFNVKIISSDTSFFTFNNDILKQRINKYLTFLSSKNSNNYTDEWFLKYFDYIKESFLSKESKVDKLESFSSYLFKFSISFDSKTISFYKILFSNQNIENDILLFFSRNCLDNPLFPMETFFELI